jgi:hypothetical protein
MIIDKTMCSSKQQDHEVQWIHVHRFMELGDNVCIPKTFASMRSKEKFEIIFKLIM